MEIPDCIHPLRVPFQITTPCGETLSRFVYSYLIYGERICLIDCAVASSENMIIEYLEKTGHRPQELSLAILTHSHPDHIGAASRLKRISGCRIAAHGAERAWIEDVGLQEKERPVPGFSLLVGGSIKVNLILHEGDIIDLGGLTLQVIHTPGHSPGSISLWCPEAGALFPADAIPIPGEMPIYQDILASVQSIQRLKEIRGIRLLLPAWDGPRYGMDAYEVMDKGLEYLNSIHRAVLRVADDAGAGANAQIREQARGQASGKLDGQIDPLDLCRKVLEELGLPLSMANPLVARSFQASLTARNKADLLDPDGRYARRQDSDLK